MDKYSYIANAHGNYVDELYRAYKADPTSIDESWQKFFEGFEFAENYNGNGYASEGLSPEMAAKEAGVSRLIFAYRSRAHLRSKTNPVRQRKSRNPWLDLELFGLSEADLDTVFQAGNELGIGPATLRKIIDTLKYIYEGTIGFEFTYIREPEVFNWLRDKFEKDALAFNPSIEFKKRILHKLNEAVVFENFLHTKFLGQKRFSLEGGDSVIPGLDALINKSAELGVKEVVIGMAHRGRLNVLANIMGKTYEQIFSEFEGKSSPDLTMGDGDVKYHMGFASEITTPEGNTVSLRLAPNPSHLEVVSSVVQGYCRAQIDEELFDEKYILPIMIHGDAAIAGQGLVYEVVQMAKLDAYKVGGTVHVVINNQVGFTTDFDEARSSIYCTDIAKLIDAPVLHVNGDDPEAVVFCFQLAAEFRQKFQRDIFIDLVCYRRHGHNETDEPRFTQPKLYNVIAKHPSPREVYAQKLASLGSIDAKLIEEMDKELRQMLQVRLDEVKQKPLPYHYTQLEKDWQKLRKARPEDFDASPKTAISWEMIEKVGKALTTIPEGFKTIKQIDKLLQDRKKMFFEEKRLDWACGELLAYGSLLLEEKIVRMSGQDVRRGTFSHRQAVLRDAETNEPYFLLDHIVPNQKQPFRIYNSHLSEFGVMGFEFGYSMANPNALVIWEAQFGDFANGAQVIIDQFLSATESKWNQQNALVLLLPHGYEGQGPEHSSARWERFLQLCAEYNMVVGNFTTSANLFHALRRQLAWEFRKPLVVMSPKSLLRAEEVYSPIEDFINGSFQEVLDDNYADPKKVKKVLLCSGKIAVDLYRYQQKNERKDVAIVRLEQLYPFPQKQLEKVLSKYKKAKQVWVQEEPLNMGAYSFMLMHYDRNLEVISRKASASPATGYNKIHEKEQQEIIQKAFEA
ncbi:2-oxoglutarate dehydrogenase E1 component [Raineya orbicola]|jgi:2-oxoglutarate dehydrogenase E1 component|uniref:oxoglutarate dehydrogenase (succinyl-transferring) n=1 Tax=Raineya orbicola TaxID=2016530 RepID=A0A2N3IIL7_9BACT|nr:2-oxoglutarate dehydrogenase E1 component [Raineya orbicola]PKQ70073.1 Oxoglutarate dehydrogenase (succinyl-transferring), E1 component [Raineya orbicola]